MTIESRRIVTKNHPDRRSGNRFDANFDSTAIRNLMQVGNVAHPHIGRRCGACARDATVHSGRGRDQHLPWRGGVDRRVV